MWLILRLGGDRLRVSSETGCTLDGPMGCRAGAVGAGGAVGFGLRFRRFKTIVGTPSSLSSESLELMMTMRCFLRFFLGDAFGDVGTDAAASGAISATEADSSAGVAAGVAAGAGAGAGGSSAGGEGGAEGGGSGSVVGSAGGSDASDAASSRSRFCCAFKRRACNAFSRATASFANASGPKGFRVRGSSMLSFTIDK